MGGLELLAVVVFFLVGYWAVDFFWPKKNTSDSPPAASPIAGDVAPSDNAPWHKVLGVPPEATLDQIRRAYEEKSAQAHPERVAGMGPEFRDSAIRLTRQINDAYEQAVRARS